MQLKMRARRSIFVKSAFVAIVVALPLVALFCAFLLMVSRNEPIGLGLFILFSPLLIAYSLAVSFTFLYAAAFIFFYLRSSKRTRIGRLVFAGSILTVVLMSMYASMTAVSLHTTRAAETSRDQDMLAELVFDALENYDRDLILSLSDNPNLNSSLAGQILYWSIQNDDAMPLNYLLRHRYVTAEMLGDAYAYAKKPELSNRTRNGIFEAIVANPNTPSEIIDDIYREYPRVSKYSLVDNPNTSIDILKNLAGDENPYFSQRARDRIARLEQNATTEIMDI